jgi:hypothetical protein
LSTEHPFRKDLDDCVEANCVTAAPTAVPTVQPTTTPTYDPNVPIRSRPGLHVKLDDSTFMENVPYVPSFPSSLLPSFLPLFRCSFLYFPSSLDLP